MKSASLAHLLEGLDPARRARLAGIQSDPRTVKILAPKTSAAPARRRQEATAEARQEATAVILVCKGLRLVNGSNTRHHWAVAARRAKYEKRLVGDALAGIEVPPPPWRVLIVRRGPFALDDDGATTSAKYVRDAIARWAGVDDGDPRWSWRVTQESGGYGVRATIRTREEGGCE